MKRKKQYTFIDLFSGAGGMSYGFEMAGFKPLLAIDNWQDALDTYKRNNPSVRTLCADLASANIEEIVDGYNLKDVDLIVGGPPCQGFSVAGKRIVDDVRNKLYKSFVGFVAVCQPKVFVMENVPNILSIGEGRVKDSIISDFSRLGYEVECKVLTASDFGVPQNRRRAIFVGTKNGAFIFPSPTVLDRITTSQAISDLPEESVSDGSDYQTMAQSDYQRWARTDSLAIYNQDTTAHNEKTVRIISLVPDGGNYKDLPEEFRNTRKVHIAWTRLNSRKPSITIDTGHRHHFHYCYNRIPTVRECARIQSFPESFSLAGVSESKQYKAIGNAVPPVLMWYVARAVSKALKSLTAEALPRRHTAGSLAT